MKTTNNNIHNLSYKLNEKRQGQNTNFVNQTALNDDFKVLFEKVSNSLEQFNKSVSEFSETAISIKESLDKNKELDIKRALSIEKLAIDSKRALGGLK